MEGRKFDAVFRLIMNNKLTKTVKTIKICTSEFILPFSHSGEYVGSAPVFYAWISLILSFVDFLQLLHVCPDILILI